MKNLLCIIVAFFVSYYPVQGVRYIIDAEFIRNDPLCGKLKKNLEQIPQEKEPIETCELEINLGSLACAQLENFSSFLIKLSRGSNRDKIISSVDLQDGSSRKFNILFPALEVLVEQNPTMTLRYTHKPGALQPPRSAEKKLPTLKSGSVVARTPFTWVSYEQKINQAFSAEGSPKRQEGLTKAQALVKEAFTEETRDGFLQHLEGLEFDDDGDFKTAMLGLKKNEIISYENQLQEQWEHFFEGLDNVKVIRVSGVVEDFGGFIKTIPSLPTLKVVQFRESAIIASELEMLIEFMQFRSGLLYVDIREGLYRREPENIFHEVWERLQSKETKIDLLKKFVMVKDLSELKALEAFLRNHFDEGRIPVDQLVYAQEAYLSFSSYFDWVLEN